MGTYGTKKMSRVTGYTVNQPDHSFSEPPIAREARVMRALQHFIRDNEYEMDDAFVAKMTKVVQTRVLVILNEMRDAKS